MHNYIILKVTVIIDICNGILHDMVKKTVSIPRIILWVWLIRDRRMTWSVMSVCSAFACRTDTVAADRAQIVRWKGGSPFQTYLFERRGWDTHTLPEVYKTHEELLRDRYLIYAKRENDGENDEFR